MTFYEEMRSVVLTHGAINNSYLDRFRNGAISDEEFQEFAFQFFNFTRFFPRILVGQLVNTEDESVAEELTKVLYSELGDGQTRRRHELLYRDFLRSIGISIHDAMTKPMLPSTRSYIDGMERLYADGSHAKALGASFGLENMAISMWDHLLPGLSILKSTRYPRMDDTYFSFHRELEATHEQAMEQAVAAVENGGEAGLTQQDREEFRSGMVAVLDFLEGFWIGLDHSGAPHAPVHSEAA